MKCNDTLISTQALPCDTLVVEFNSLLLDTRISHICKYIYYMINIATFLFSFKKIALFITVVDLFSKCIYQKTGVINFQPYYVTCMFITFPPIVHFLKWTYKFCDTLEKKLSDSRHFKLDTSHVIRHFNLLDPPILVLFLLQFNCPYGRGKDTSVQKNHRKRHFCFYVWKKSHFCTSKDTTVYQKSLLSIKSHFCLYRIIFHPKTKAAFEKDTSVLPKVTSVLKKWSFAKFPSRWNE